MTKVRCKVDHCLFWGKGDHCTADEIWVRYSLDDDEDDELLYRSALELGEELMGRREETGVTSSQTCCETMQPKKGEDSGSCKGCW